MYLATPLDDPKYMHMPMSFILEAFALTNTLHEKSKDAFGYMYGLYQATIFANKYLSKCLVPFAYYKLLYIPGHTTSPIQFTLAVDDFGVNYIGFEYNEHLANHCSKIMTIIDVRYVDFLMERLKRFLFFVQAGIEEPSRLFF